MKLPIALLFTFFFIQVSTFAQVTAMSFNIRYSNPNDGENWWENRKQDVVALMDRYHPDIIGIQEGLDHQVQYLDESLIDYQYVGTGRDGKGVISEYTAIYFDSTKYSLINTKTFWLSPTPNTVSKGWDAALNRISTYVSLKEISTGSILHVFNAHFDHIGMEAREKSAELILKQIDNWNLKQASIVIMGDFNSTPDTKTITLLNKELSDTRTAAPEKSTGPEGTFSAFDADAELSNRIDYIFTKNMEVINQRHIDDLRPNLLWPSDHLPVYVVLHFSN